MSRREAEALAFQSRIIELISSSCSLIQHTLAFAEVNSSTLRSSPWNGLNSSVWLVVLEQLHEIRGHELQVRADDFRDLNALGAGGDITLRIGKLVLRWQNKGFRGDV